MKVFKLDEICSTINGLWTGKKPPFEKVYVIRNTNFTKDCKLNLDNVAELNVEVKQLASRKLYPEDLIVEKSGGGPKQAVGRVILFNEKDGVFSFSNFTSALRLKDPFNIYSKYIQLFLYLKYVSGETEGMQSNSTGIRNLNMKEFMKIEVPIPTLKTQKQIVEKLDKAFAEIDSLEKNFKIKEEKTNQLLQSMLSAAFTNTQEFDIKVVKLGNICEFTRGLTYKKSDEVDFSQNIVLRANNIDLNTNSLILDDLRYIKDSIKINSEKLVKKNSLIICTASGSKSHLGKVALITKDYGYSFGGFMGQITPSKECHHRFLFYILTSPNFKNFLMSMTDGTNINNLKFIDIENYEVPLPKYEDQVEIVAKLDKVFTEIDKLKNQISIEKELMSSLRQSILSNAFNFEENAA